MQTYIINNVKHNDIINYKSTFIFVYRLRENFSCDTDIDYVLITFPK